MIQFEAVVVQVGGVAPADLTDWIARGWIVPGGAAPDWQFAEADIVRARLVRSLRAEAGIDEDNVAMVLSLLDQVRGLRRALHAMMDAAADLPPEARKILMARLRA